MNETATQPALYGSAHTTLQQSAGSRALADRLVDAIVRPALEPEHAGFIGSRDFFFLTTIDHRGYPTCSHKGGPVGTVRVLDPHTLAFPSLDGNGMYLSMGNITANPKVGLLFIDFETPHRVRVHGDASIDPHDPLIASFPGAELVVRVAISELFVNCPRYIQPHQRLGQSKYVPAADGHAPMPAWKEIDVLQDVLVPKDQAARAAEGTPPISLDDYTERLLRGQA